MHARAEEIMEFATSLDGVTYRRRGRDLGGLDCVGVPIITSNHVLGTNFVYNQYGDSPNPLQFRREMLEAGCTHLLPHTEEPGDIIVLAAPKWPVHCAVLLLDNYMVHAFLPRKRVEVVPYEGFRYRGAFRFPEA